MIPLVKPYIPEREVLMPELEKILYSGYIAEGEAVYQFEAQFSKFIGNPFAGSSCGDRCASSGFVTGRSEARR